MVVAPVTYSVYDGFLTGVAVFSDLVWVQGMDESDSAKSSEWGAWDKSSSHIHGTAVGILRNGLGGKSRRCVQDSCNVSRQWWLTILQHAGLDGVLLK